MFLLTFLFLHVTFPVLKATDTLGVNLLLISNNIIDKGRSVVAIYNMSVVFISPWKIFESCNV